MNLLHLGCGYDYREGWVNADLNDKVKKDIKVDFNNALPWDDESFDHIYSAHTIEHVYPQNIIYLMIELHRVLKKGGILELKMPHFSHYSALGMTHYSVFSINMFRFFEYDDALLNIPNVPNIKGPMFKIVLAKLYHQRVSNGDNILVDKSLYYYVAKFISYLANLNTHLCEKFWCYWVGGFQEMHIKLVKQ